MGRADGSQRPSRPSDLAPGFGVGGVAAQLLESDQLFIPVDEHQLSEGERLFVELVPPNCHAVFRTLAEVTWVDGRDGRSGIALRFAGMTDTDRHLLESLRSYVAQQGELS